MIVISILIILCILSRISAEYQLGIKDSIMIAHSFKGKEFGPAQNLHGATYTVDVDFYVNDIVDGLNWVIDIGTASEILANVLQKYNFKNLDELFPCDNTTTEFMCRAIHGDMKDRLRASKAFSGKMSVKLHESHKAWASFTEEV